MFNKKRFSTLIAILTVGSLLFGCAKDGATGPAGPQGANGTAGPTGPAGPAGPTGATGSANVIYSPWITVPQGTLVDNLWYYDIPVPQLTADMVNNGAILCYIGASNTAFALPFTEADKNGNGVSYFTSAHASDKKITLHVRAVGPIPANWATRTLAVQFRYIIIPGSVKTSVNLKDYNEVVKHFNIQ